MARTTGLSFLMSRTLLAALLASLSWQTVSAADADPCTHFTWNVTHQLAVMKQPAQPVTAAAKPASDIPLLQLDKVYELALAEQSGVTFAVPPGKPTLADGTRAGLVRFSTAAAGRYRVGITSGHW